MDKTEIILKKILKEIKPSEEEEKFIKNVSYEFLSKLKRYNFNVIIGGSLAKNTWLSGNHDIDIFVMFPKEYENKDLSNLLKNILNKTFKKFIVVHGSRDYFQIKKGKNTFEIIPVLKISKIEDAKNIMDISPLHVSWVRKSIGNLSDDVRLAKKFFIAQGIYGAESYIGGFSGYVIEILTTYYNGFKNLIKAGSKWKEKEVIDINHYYDKDALKVLNKSKIYSPLIVIDPIQKERNAAAALTLEKFNKFINACKLYLKKPSTKLFIKKEIKISDLKRKKAIILEIEPLKGKEDIIGSKILKVFRYIKSNLIQNEFKIKEANWEWNKKAVLWYILKSKTLNRFKKHYGPPINKKANLESFKKKWKDYTIKREGNVVYVNIPRKFVRSKEFIKYMIKDKRITNNVRSIKPKAL